jgi:hypothetical protein
MIAQQLGASDVAGVHTRDRVVHHQVHVDLGEAAGLPECPIALAQVVAPLEEGLALLVVLDEVAHTAVGREDPGSGFLGMHQPAGAHCPHQAPHHRTRQRNIEGPRRPTLWLGIRSSRLPKFTCSTLASSRAPGRLPDSKRNRWNSRRIG